MKLKDIKTAQDVKQDYIDKRNELEKWINKAVPLLQARLDQGFKLKADGSLFASVQKDIDVILLTAPFRAFLKCSYGNIALNCDITSVASVPDANGYHGARYIKRYFYLWANDKTTEFTPYKRVTMKQYQFAIGQSLVNRDKIADLQRQQDSLKSKFDL